MKESKGYVALHRSIQDHWVWKTSEKHPASKGQAWADLILMANYAEGKVTQGNKYIKVRRGSFVTSTRKLGDRWHWSKDKVKRFLNALEADGMIQQKADTKRTIITLVNYDKLQSAATTSATRTRRKQSTTATQTSTNNKKNKKNKKEESACAPEPPVWAAQGFASEAEYIAYLRR